MLIWKGFGFLTVALAFLLILISTELSKNTTILSYVSEGVMFIVSCVIFSALNFLIGRHFNKVPGRVLIDPKTNEKLELKQQHSLFWIPMEYWSILGVIGIIITLVE